MAESQAAIQTRGLGKIYRTRTSRVHAVEDLDLAVDKGEIFGLLGPNGAGKTTTIRLLCGLLEPTEGEAWIDGISVSAEPDQARSCVGLVPEDAGHYRHLTVLEELRYFGAIHGLEPSVVAERSAPLIEMLGLGDRLQDRLGTFSKGMRRKVHLVRALLHEPRILLLDEPTDGLDPAVAEEVWELLKSLAQERDMTIVLCSHHLEEIERLCGRIAILKRTLLALGDLSALLRRGTRYRVRLAGPAEAHVAAAAQVAGVRDVVARADQIDLAIEDERAVMPLLVRSLVEAGAPILEIQRQETDLRSRYREIVNQDVEPGEEDR